MPLYLATYTTRQQGRLAYHSETISAANRKQAAEQIHNRRSNVTKGIRIKEIRKQCPTQ